MRSAFTLSPELPDVRRARYEADWACAADADILTSEMQVADFFEQAVAAYGTGVDRPQRRSTGSLANFSA
ncbi:MAG: hypothetical protein R2856_22210 [Caldilineaceae bacterium]